ncbi:HAMP domain-containing sensor histidine kinase [Paractinoplanes ferrugineus]|uniref:histidine kinase n=1 Tax=Paractinoplanes ferrugineus TaxID=113564 RepID=A0A919J2Y1_9ACTN|nr:ATP-binding protein [Actinoplanes ferrugineus]GIE13811.1 sensor protein CutS [Actinoplanes ferrugineus]
MRFLGHRTVRFRLTVLYGALFLVCGTMLVAITYILASQFTPDAYTSRGPNGETNALVVSPTKPDSNGSPQFSSQDQADSATHSEDGTSAQAAEFARRAQELSRAQRTDQLDALLVQSLIALGITTVIALGAGWLMAGRQLSRLQQVTGAARTISASNLHERLALDGPHDELKDLGDTFDGLLARLEDSFVAQRRFIANVSHELRTPLTRQRTVAQVALSDPDATVESLRAAHERVLAAGLEQEQLLMALLRLARGQAGLGARTPFDLARLTEEVVLSRADEAKRRGLEVQASYGPAWASGDVRLTEGMIGNLVDNALRHNVEGGHVEISTHGRDDQAVLTVSNTGRPIPGSRVEQLFEPFERGGADRVGRGEGLGLGLSIVRAIADAHDADLVAVPRPRGGLRITVALPAGGRCRAQCGSCRRKPVPNSPISPPCGRCSTRSTPTNPPTSRS